MTMFVLLFFTFLTLFNSVLPGRSTETGASPQRFCTVTHGGKDFYEKILDSNTRKKKKEGSDFDFGFWGVEVGSTVKSARWSLVIGRACW